MLYLSAWPFVLLVIGRRRYVLETKKCANIFKEFSDEIWPVLSEKIGGNPVGHYPMIKEDSRDRRRCGFRG